MLIRGGDVFLQDNSFKRCDIRIADGKIVELAPLWKQCQAKKW